LLQRSFHSIALPVGGRCLRPKGRMRVNFRLAYARARLPDPMGLAGKEFVGMD
jgi:hypothetical protein